MYPRRRPHHARFANWWDTLAGVLALSCPVIMAIQVFTEQPVVQFIVVLLTAAGSVLFVVRRINRRDDPRYARQPPDAPQDST